MSEPDSMEIAPILKELYEITEELKQLKTEVKSLNDQKKEKEQKIIEYLKHVDQPGIKYKNIIIFNEEKPKHRTKKKKDKQNDIKRVLRDAGIEDVDTVYNQILEESKGKEEFVDALKVKIIKSRN